VVCVSNIRQIGVASINLAADNKGWINGINAPREYDGSAGIASVSNYWTVRLNDYLATPQDTLYYNYNTLIRRGSGCPNATWVNPTAANNAQWIGYGSFGGNSQFVGWGYAPMHSLDEAQHTTRVSLAAECGPIWTYSTPYYLDETNYGDASVFMAPRHRAEGINVVYVDGHAGFLGAPAPGSPYPGSYAPSYGPWWNDVAGATLWYPYSWDFGFLKE
jgi:prepilin-type processing-associated H-X9-DG protein